MSNSLRCWLAGLLLAFSVIVLTAGSDPRDFGARGLLLLAVLFTHVWVIAVAERVGSDRGGVEIKRFPIGPRRVQARPGLGGQFLVPVALLGLATMDWRVAAVVLAVVCVLSIDVLRGLMVYTCPRQRPSTP